MKNALRIVVLLTVFISCNNNSSLNKPLPTSLDSLLNFDTIIAIYTSNELPLKILDDAIEGNDTKPSLHIDSTNRWTNSRSIIDSVRMKFPKLSSFGNSVWETTCCRHQELIIKTKKGEHVIYWLNFNDYGGIKFNDKYYKTNRGQLNNLINLLDRKIIRKEIYLDDSIKFSLNDYYNKRNTNEYHILKDTRYVYILK